MGLTQDEFVDKVSEDMVAISRDFVRRRAGEFYKVKITLPQMAILEQLQRSGELNMSDMARFINVTTAAMTGVITRLVRDGYVARASQPGDRRVIKIKLTAKGEKIMKSVIEQRRQLFKRMFGTLSDREREDYLKILSRIREGLKA